MAELEDPSIWDATDAQGNPIEDPEIARLSAEELRQRTILLEEQLRIMNEESARVVNDSHTIQERITDNRDKIKMNKQLPYLVGNVVEILTLPKEEGDEDADEGSTSISADGPSLYKDPNENKSAVIKTSTRQTVFLPTIGLVNAAKLKPGQLVGTNKDSYLVLEALPSEYDSRVKAMEVDERPTEEFTDVGGLDKQIQELLEAVVLPMTHKEKFLTIGIKPPKGILLYGPPGTGKTLMARACARMSDAVFLKLAGPQLVQMFIGDGAKLVRDAFELAKEKGKGRGGAIIFIDEIDAVGSKRYDSDQAGDREVQRTMLELLSQLDGFTANDTVKVIAATNRPDILDPALMRSGRLDRKVELPHPTEEARAQILRIHSRKMNVDLDEVNFEELARSTAGFNGAQLKAVCVEGGMLALRRNGTIITHEDFVEGIAQVESKKKGALVYYA